jgi:hypothetical protein
VRPGKRTSVYLTADLDLALKCSGRGIAEILREALANELAAGRNERTRRALIFWDEARLDDPGDNQVEFVVHEVTRVRGSSL